MDLRLSVIGLVVADMAATLAFYRRLGLDLPAEADAWLASAQEHPGSWWTDWAAWLKSHAGKQVPAPKKLGNARHQPTEPAPGRYVKAKARA